MAESHIHSEKSDVSDRRERESTRIVDERSLEGKQVVVLDTNALVMPFQHKINLDVAIVKLVGRSIVVVPEIILKELAGLAERENGIFSSAMKLAARYDILAFANDRTHHDRTARNFVDNEMVRLAGKLQGIASCIYFVTNDVVLQKALERTGVRVVGMRAGGKLAIIGRRA